MIKDDAALQYEIEKLGREYDVVYTLGQELIRKKKYFASESVSEAAKNVHEAIINLKVACKYLDSEAFEQIKMDLLSE